MIMKLTEEIAAFMAQQFAALEARIAALEAARNGN